jgi:hypothetical protein
MPLKLTTEIINASIEGFEIQKASIDAKISELRDMLPSLFAQADHLRHENSVVFAECIETFA